MKLKILILLFIFCAISFSQCKPGPDPFTGLFVNCASVSGSASGPTGPTGPSGPTGPTGPTGPSAVTGKTLYYSPAAKNINATGAAAFQCYANCPSPSAISTGTAATAELLVTTATSNQTSQDSFIVPATFANQTTTVEVIWRTSDTNAAHTATVTPTFVCVGSGDIANPTFAAAGGAITLTPPGNTNRTVSTGTFTPSCSAGNTAFWLLSYNTTSGGGGAITNLGILSVRFYATF